MFLLYDIPYSLVANCEVYSDFLFKLGKLQEWQKWWTQTGFSLEHDLTSRVSILGELYLEEQAVSGTEMLRDPRAVSGTAELWPPASTTEKLQSILSIDFLPADLISHQQKDHLETFLERKALILCLNKMLWENWFDGTGGLLCFWSWWNWIAVLTFVLLMQIAYFVHSMLSALQFLLFKPFWRFCIRTGGSKCISLIQPSLAGFSLPALKAGLDSAFLCQV